MKNITLNIVFLMTLFTFIGCDNLPIQPEIDDSTNYSITPNTLNGEETMSEVVPQANGFIVNKKIVPEDSMLYCLNLSQDQWNEIKIVQSWWKPVYNHIHTKWKENLQLLDITTQQNFKKLNIKRSDPDYRKVMIEINKIYKSKIDSINKIMGDSLTRRQNDHYFRGISPILNDEQRAMFLKWVENPKLTCEFLKP
jgi:hypothetical protein